MNAWASFQCCVLLADAGLERVGRLKSGLMNTTIGLTTLRMSIARMLDFFQIMAQQTLHLMEYIWMRERDITPRLRLTE